MNIALPLWTLASSVHAYDYIHGASNPSTPKRVVSIGDLHGDYDDTCAILTSLGIMGSEGKWIGGTTTLVQTGDVSDRGPKSKEIYDLLHHLQDQAPKVGGKVLLLIGNHELMNLQGSFDYASEAENEDYGGLEARKKTLSPSGALGRALRERHQTVALVENTPGSGDGVLFVHGGLRPEFVEKLGQQNVEAVHALNDEASSLLHGDASSLIESSNPLFGDDGPYWSRHFSLGGQDEVVCSDLERTLKVFKARRMVVGHTIQEDGRIGSRCGGRLLLGDTAISSWADHSGTSHRSAIVWKDFATADAWATYPSVKSGYGSLLENGKSSRFFALETPPRSQQSKLTPMLRSRRHEEDEQ